MSDIAKCPLCQKYIDITFNSETCPHCGGNITGHNLKPEVPSRYNSVGGWLLFLCVGLTILTPLLNFSTIMTELKDANEISAYYPEIYSAVIVEVIFTLIIVAASIYVGVSLWTISPKAVSKAKLFLGLLPFFTIAGIFLTYLFLPAVGQSEFAKQSIFPIVRTFIYSGLWFFYLTNSQRVAETYPDE